MDALGRLAGGVAHDFNNMLAVISGYSQLLLDELQDHPRHQAWLTEIARAGERAAELTRRLLIFSRKSLPRPVLLELNDVVQGLEGMLHRTIGENVHLRVRLGPDVGYVQADLSQLEQVAVNLVVNARDAMPDGGEITIETRSTVLSERQPGSKGRVGPHVVLSVSDTGSGIVPEAMAHLFEPFFTTKPHGKGTGLGLATVYSIVEQSQGFITVATDAGNGSRFDIHLPQATAPTEPLPARRPIAPSVAGTGTILLVEDQPLVLGMARSILLRAGYEVLEATRGEEALECFERCGAEVDLVLTDVVMPGMSGGELVERLRERDPGLRVLCMSGHPDDLPLMRRLRDQEFAFLPKPFTPAELTRIVADLMASSPVRVPAGVARELAEPCVQ